MDVRRYENQLKFAVKACLYAVLITPIIVGPKYLYPFVFPKAAVFQALVELALLLYVLLLIIDRSYLPRRNVILWGVVAYVGAIALSNVLAIDRMLAFWSKAERMDGLFQYLHLLVFFFILTGVLKREAEWLGFLKWNMVAGVFVGGAALISKFAPKVLPFGDQDRLGGTFGNPAFLATYYVVLSFFALIFLLREKVPRLKICYALLFLYFLFLLVISGTRGGYIGFLAGVVVFITSLLASDWKRWGKLAIVVVVLGVVLVGTLYAGKGFFSAKSNFVRDRIYHIFELPQARLVSWKIALEAFRAKPILGWGQENYIHAFNAHFDPEIHT
ncbi:MAG: O-antigen ligase family protein, partial [Parcubacteria group bacterium]|nr:O-antigen ligase family protein [Parcubacteria group bacterium]